MCVSADVFESRDKVKECVGVSVGMCLGVSLRHTTTHTTACNSTPLTHRILFVLFDGYDCGEVWESGVLSVCQSPTSWCAVCGSACVRLCLYVCVCACCVCICVYVCVCVCICVYVCMCVCVYVCMCVCEVCGVRTVL